MYKYVYVYKPNVCTVCMCVHPRMTRDPVRQLLHISPFLIEELWSNHQIWKMENAK